MKRHNNNRQKGFGQAFTLVLAAGLILFAGWGYSHETRASKAYTPNNLMRQSGEAVPADNPVAMSTHNVVRLHVRGNSNEKADQDVKVEVKDALMATFGEALSNVAGPKEAEELLESAIAEVESISASCLQKSNFEYGVRAAVKMDYFPEKQYELASGELYVLPAGWYKALVVDLGKGEGDNWWCVMYPPLCYFDLVQRAVQKYGGTSGENVREAALIVDELSTKEVPVEVRSLLLDSLRSGIKRLAALWTRERSSMTGVTQVP